MRHSILILIILLQITCPAAAQEWELVETVGRGKIDDVLWLPDGRLALFGARGIWIYSEFTPNAESTLIESSSGWIHSAAISGNILVTGHDNGSITIWDAGSLAETAHFGDLGWAVKSVSLNVDGTRVATASGESVRVWDIPSQTLILELAMEEIIDDLAISPDGQWLYVLSRMTFAQTNDIGNPTQLDIIEIDQPQDRQRITGLGNDFVYHIGISPDGRWLILPGIWILSIWDVAQGELLLTDIFASEASIPIITDQGIYLNHPWGLSAIDTDTWTVVETIDSEEEFYSSQAAFADPWVAQVSFEGHFNETLRLWNRESGEFFDFPYESAVNSLVLTEDGISVNIEEEEVETRDAPSEDFSEPVTLRAVPGSEQTLFWSKPYPIVSGECIGCAQPSVGFVLYTTGTNGNDLEKLVETDSFTALDVALSPDETYVAVGGNDGQVHFVDLETGNELSVLFTGQGAINAILFDPQGRLITGHSSGLVQIWELN